MSYPWIKDSQYLTSPVTGYLAVTAPNGLYLTDGSSSTTITPTSVTATTFNGTLNGSVTNATNATNVAIADDNTNATFYPVFVSNNTGNLSLKVDKTTNPLSYNPSTGIFISQVFSPGNGTSTFSALSTTGLEVTSATTGRTLINNNQITCATTATGTPPVSTITPTSITCSSLNAASTTTITPTSVTSTTFTGALSGNATSATTATTATNIAGGAAGRISYQTGTGATSFIAVGNGGQFLQANGPAAPTWVTQNGTATVTLTNPANPGNPTNWSTTGTAILTANFGTSYSCVTRYPVTISNSNGTITISVNTYTLSGGLTGGQYTIVLEITMAGNAGTTLNFNGTTGPATGAKFNFAQITNTYGGTTATKYLVLTFVYDGTNYYMSGSNFS